MSLLARCPSCATLYKVVADQLRVSDGWVRCGHCGEIFDGPCHLVDAVGQPEPQAANLAETVGVPPPEFVATVEPLDAVADALTFMRHQRQPVFWQGTKMRTAMGLVGFFLMLTLLGQWLYQDRDQLAATRPALLPVLQTMCGVLNCRIEPMRNIDAMVIDSAAFNVLEPGSYRLSFVIRNTSRQVLAVPAVELTLTDALDHVMVRRVFLPQELGAKTVTLDPGVEWPTSVTLQLQSVPDDARMLGYRVLAFYP